MGGWVVSQVGGWASALLGSAGGWLLTFLMLHGTHWPPPPHLSFVPLGEVPIILILLASLLALLTS